MPESLLAAGCSPFVGSNLLVVGSNLLVARPSRLAASLRRAGLALVVSAGLLPMAAHACCGDGDAGCWIAAAATGGLSCAIEDAQRESRRILDVATTARNSARNAYSTATSATTERVNQAKNEAQSSSESASTRINQAQQRVQVTVNAPRFTNAALLQNLGPLSGARGGLLAAPAPAGAAPAASGARTVVVVRASPAPAPAPAPSGRVAVTASSTSPAANPSAGGEPRRPELETGLPTLPSPPSPEEVRRALDDALRTLDALRERARNRDLPNVTRAIATMNTQVLNGLHDMNGVVQTAVFSPLEVILRELGRADPTGLTTLLAAAVTGIDAATYALENEVFRGLQAIDQLSAGLMGELESKVSELVAASDLAEQIQGAVGALSDAPTQPEMAALRRLLPADPAALMSVASLRGLSLIGPVGGSLRSAALPLSADSAGMMKTALLPLSNQLKDPLLRAKLQPPNKLQLVPRAQQVLAGQFSGLNAAQKALKRQQLLTEARNRLGSNPGAMQEAERLIAQAAGPDMVAPMPMAATMATTAAPPAAPMAAQIMVAPGAVGAAAKVGTPPLKPVLQPGMAVK